MVLTNQTVYSKATFKKGKIKGTTKDSVTISFCNEIGIKVKLSNFLDLLICSKEVEDEIKRRLDELYAVQE